MRTQKTSDSAAIFREYDNF